MCLVQAHKTVPLVKLEPATPLSQVKYSTTEPLCSHQVLRDISKTEDEACGFQHLQRGPGIINALKNNV